MSENQSHHHFMQQLNIGNVISLGFYLYRSHLKQYFKLALSAHLWLLVPIYGWAKFYAIAGLLSRLAFNELSGQTESLKAANLYINRRKWRFLITGILVILICLIQFFIFYILFSFIAGIIFYILATIFGSPQQINPANPFSNLLGAIILIPTAIAVYLSPLWFYSRLFITDLPLATEDNINSIAAIKQSRQLTKGLRLRMIAIIFISFLISLPLQIILWLFFSLLFNLIIQLIYKFSNTVLNPDDTLLSTLFLIILSFVNGIILMPFWQSIKSVVYYDILCRQEGFDLKLRDRNLEITP